MAINRRLQKSLNRLICRSTRYEPLGKQTARCAKFLVIWASDWGTALDDSEKFAANTQVLDLVWVGQRDNAEGGWLEVRWASRAGGLQGSACSYQRLIVEPSLRIK